MQPFDRETVVREPGQESGQARQVTGLGGEVVRGQLEFPLGAARDDGQQVGEYPENEGDHRELRAVVDGHALPGPGGDRQPTDPPREQESLMLLLLSSGGFEGLLRGEPVAVFVEESGVADVAAFDA